MCPLCVTTVVLMASGVASAGGLGVATMKRRGAKRSDGLPRARRPRPSLVLRRDDEVDREDRDETHNRRNEDMRQARAFPRRDL